MNTQIKTWVGTVIIIIIAITTSYLVWFVEKNNQIEVRTQIVKVNPVKKQLNKDQASQEVSKIDYQNIAFDACGKEAKYQNLAWWDEFKNKIEQINFYSEDYIKESISIQRNEDNAKYNNDYVAYCGDKSHADYDICLEKNKKMSEEDFTEMEGCLSLDGAAFISVFPGQYMGGGNYIFRYDVKNNILESASRIKNSDTEQLWVAPPTAFLKRSGSVIIMTGSSGDAGCGMDNTFYYNFVTNQVGITKSCTYCSDQKNKDCTTYQFDENTNWQTYRNEKYGFEIQYPSRWFVSEDDVPNSIVAPSISFMNVEKIDQNGGGLTPAYGDSWQNEAVFFISVLSNRSLYPLEKWYEEAHKNDPPALVNSISNSSLLVGERKTIMENPSDRDAYQFFYVEDNSKVIQLGYRTHQTKFTSFYNQILSTFKFTN